MKCPNCGYEIAEGYLYCEKCGMEIQIVPVFEPEIENSITETLSTVAEEIEGNGSLKEENADELKTPAPPESGKGRKKKPFLPHGDREKAILCEALPLLLQ